MTKSKFNCVTDRGYWDDAARKDNVFSRVRSTWTEEQFRNDTEHCLVTMFDMEFDQDGGLFLDLGCGVGYAAKIVCPHVSEYHGVDFSAPMLVCAREFNKQFQNAKFTLCDGQSIPYEDEFFDYIITEQMFYHVPKDGILTYLEEILRVLAPSGVALIEIPKASAYVNGLNEEDVEEIFGDHVEWILYFDTPPETNPVAYVRVVKPC